MKKWIVCLIALTTLLGGVTVSFAEALPAPEEKEYFGSPWVNTIDNTNIPADRGTPADDLNLYMNFDLFDAMRDSYDVYQGLVTGSGDLKDTVLKILQDPEITSPLLEKVRIFFNQAMDTDHLKELGIEPARPYLDMLDAVTDLEGLNAVLTSEDFPFSPFLSAYLCPRDSREPMSFALYPNFMTTDNLEGAKNLKEKSVIGAQADSEKTNLVRQILMKLYPDTETELLYQRLASFEKQYGQYGIYTDLFSSMEYGTADRLISQMTVPEMEEAFKNFPVRGILEKDGRDLSLTYKIPCREWLEELDRMWTEDNLETLVLAAKVKVLQDAAPALTPVLTNGTRIMTDILLMLQADPDALKGMTSPEDFPIDQTEYAYAACNQTETFAYALAQIFTETRSGDVDLLKDLTAQLVDTYRGLLKETSWMSETGLEDTLAKLDSLTVCILEPYAL